MIWSAYASMPYIYMYTILLYMLYKTIYVYWMDALSVCTQQSIIIIYNDNINLIS